MTTLLASAAETVLEATISASILAALILMLQLVLGKRLSAAWRFALWLPVLLRLLVPVFPESSISIFNAPRWLASLRGGDPTAQLFPLDYAKAASAAIEPISISSFASSLPEKPAESVNLKLAATGVWAVIATSLLIRVVFGSLWFRSRLKKSAVAAPRLAMDEFLAAAHTVGWRQRVSLVETELVESPALFGLWKPTLLLPTGFSDRLSPSEMRHVFLHELAHLKRRDLLLNWGMSVAMALHWFNPIAWLVFRRMRLERELACDQMVLRLSGSEGSKAYGNTILKLLEGLGPRTALPVLVGIAEEKHSAKRRLQQIAAFRTGSRRYWLALPVLLAVAIAGLTNAQGPERPIPEADSTVVPRKKAEAESQTLSEKLERTRVDRITWSAGIKLTEAIETIREKLPTDLKEVKFYWQQTTNIAGARAIGYINTVIGSQPTSADEVRLVESGVDRMPPLVNRSAFQLLEFLAARSSVPLQFEVETNAVVFWEARKAQSESEKLADNLINDARVLMEMGKLDEAETKLREAITEDKRNARALYYLRLIDQRRDGKGANIYSSPSRQSIVQKLKSIVLDDYQVKEVSLSDVVKDLHATARARDPQNKGVNFLINSSSLQQAGTATKDLRLENFVVTINPPLRDVSMLDVVDAIVRVAKPPKGTGSQVTLAYAIEDYALVFNARKDEDETLYTRTYRVDPNTFIESLNHSGRVFLPSEGVWDRDDRPETASAQLQERVRNFFIAAGINFSTNQLVAGTSTPPQKAIFYNDRTGVLFVRATLRELDIVEIALQALNVTPPQITLEAQSIQLESPEDLAAIRNFLTKVQKKFRPALTDAEFRRFKQELKEQAEFQLLSFPRVTTLSGRGARVETGDLSVDVMCNYRERNSTFSISTKCIVPSEKRTLNEGYGFIYDGQTFIAYPKGDEISWPSQIVFITATLIDAAGNRIHSNDTVTFDTEVTPLQP